MPRAPRQSAVTQDFQAEFEAQTQTLLRTRFIRFAGLMGLLAASLLLVSLTAGVISLLLPGSTAEDAASDVVRGSRSLHQFVIDSFRPDRHWIIAWAFGAAIVGAYAASFFAARRGSFVREGMLRLTYTLIVADGLLHVGGSWLDAPGMLGIWAVMVTHTVACLFLPWTAGQAIRPLLPVLAVNALLFTFLKKTGTPAHVVFRPAHDIDVALVVLKFVFSLLVAVPGVTICLIRHSQRMSEFKLNFFEKRYGKVRQELFDARRIHESLFPKTFRDGPIQFAYQYEPMHQIGGDFLYIARASSGGPLNAVVLDVTGHGIPAALTVNRLHGELQRIFAEDPNIGPGRVLSLLNRYVNLTLSDHTVFATALCLRIDPNTDTLDYASGGHPTAYIRAVDNTVTELASTSLLLGAMPYADYMPEPQSLPFHAGDTLIAYTDGAIEARNHDGRMLGLLGMQRLVAATGKIDPGSWPGSVLRHVGAYRHGPPEDDTLVVEIHRPINPTPSAISHARSTMILSPPLPVSSSRPQRV